MTAKIAPFGLLFILIAAACSSAAAGSNSANNSQQANVVNAAVAATQAPAENTLPLNDAGVALVARVNGAEIDAPTFERALARRQLEVDAANIAALQTAVLDTLIEQTLIEQAAQAQQIIISDEDLELELQAHIAQAGDSAGWNEWLANNLYTDDEFREALHSSLITARLRDVITQSIGQEIDQVHARHILVATETEVNDLLARLQAGEDFATLAGSHSRDVTTRDQGGDLGWFAQGELLEETLTDVAFSLENGQVAGPIITRLGYHIVQTLDKTQRPITDERRVNLSIATFDSWLQAQVQSATIERFMQ